MKLILLDENVPRFLSLTTELEVVSVTDLGASLTDTEIWKFATKNDALIVTKDSDFSHRIRFVDPPPRVVRLRIGNMRRRSMIGFLEKIWPQVERLAASHKLVNVFEDRLEGFN